MHPCAAALQSPLRYHARLARDSITPHQTTPHHLAYQPLITAVVYNPTAPSISPPFSRPLLLLSLTNPTQPTTHDSSRHDFNCNIISSSRPLYNSTTNYDTQVPGCPLTATATATAPGPTANSPTASVAAQLHKQPCPTSSSVVAAPVHPRPPTMVAVAYPSQPSASPAHSRLPRHPSTCGGVACRPTPTQTQLTRVQLRKMMLRLALRPPRRPPSSDA